MEYAFPCEGVTTISVFAAPPPERVPKGLNETVTGVILVTRSLSVTGLKTVPPNVTVAFPPVIAVVTVTPVPRLIAAVLAMV
jgi:hypothetical protein